MLHKSLDLLYEGPCFVYFPAVRCLSGKADFGSDSARAGCWPVKMTKLQITSHGVGVGEYGVDIVIGHKNAEMVIEATRERLKQAGVRASFAQYRSGGGEEGFFCSRSLECGKTHTQVWEGQPTPMHTVWVIFRVDPKVLLSASLLVTYTLVREDSENKRPRVEVPPSGEADETSDHERKGSRHIVSKGKKAWAKKRGSP